ncbi:MAG: hypothetical protein FWC73_04410 [Defluviitaleaceae bacterium]|nr:hypothetical protein [Defluviitaleaceae bacterium]
MKLQTGISYNMDMLCFLNIMTGDEFYVTRHKEAFERWYPQLSNTIKTKINEFTAKRGNSMLSPTITLFTSSLNDFNNRNLVDMLGCFQEIENSMNMTPYIFGKEEFEAYFSFFTSTVIPVISELEKKGFYDFWVKNRLPAIREKCTEIDRRLGDYEIDEIMSRFGDIDNSDCTIFLCSFADPLGIKLCGNNLITDASYSLDIILSNATHELFHPPYKIKRVRDYVQKLFDMPWVKDAFDNQDPNSGYNTMEGFIEENIVEALGIYVAIKLGAGIQPYEYFKNHDGGSHVISPHFYHYLCENQKECSKPFEDYFISFVESF